MSDRQADGPGVRVLLSDEEEQFVNQTAELAFGAAAAAVWQRYGVDLACSDQAATEWADWGEADRRFVLGAVLATCRRSDE
jgi:hypothetical protein